MRPLGATRSESRARGFMRECFIRFWAMLDSADQGIGHEQDIVTGRGWDNDDANDS